MRAARRFAYPGPMVRACYPPVMPFPGAAGRTVAQRSPSRPRTARRTSSLTPTVIGPGPVARTRVNPCGSADTQPDPWITAQCAEKRMRVSTVPPGSRAHGEPVGPQRGDAERVGAVDAVQRPAGIAPDRLQRRQPAADQRGLLLRGEVQRHARGRQRDVGDRVVAQPGDVAAPRQRRGGVEQPVAPAVELAQPAAGDRHVVGDARGLPVQSRERDLHADRVAFARFDALQLRVERREEAGLPASGRRPRCAAP